MTCFLDKFSTLVAVGLLVFAMQPTWAQESDEAIDSESNISQSEVSADETTDTADAENDSQDSEQPDAESESDSENETPEDEVKPSATNEPAPLEIQWYRPSLKPGSKKGLKHLTLTGKVNKTARIYIGRKSIPTIVKSRVRKFPTKKAFVGANNPTKRGFGTTTDEYGEFELQLELPQYPVQLPLKVFATDKTKSTVVLKLYVQKEEQEVIDKDKITPRLRRDKKYGLWGGLGANYLNYSQTTDIESELEYASFAAPSAYLGAKYNFNRQWAISLEATYTPGTVENDSDNAFVSLDETYSWTILDVNGHYYPRGWDQRKFLFGKYADYGIRFGVQHQLMPFIETAGVDPDTSKNAISIEQKAIDFLTAGFFLKAYDNSNWVYELYMRYQHPIVSPTEVTIAPKFAFDGSIGTYYLYNTNLRFGFFWYGQYQNYDFSDLDEEYIVSRPISGTQTLLFSNIEFRIGYEF
ncbi:MAG: hypothetical protein R2827_07020 [Bdellovibrionales bacterium]